MAPSPPNIDPSHVEPVTAPQRRRRFRPWLVLFVGAVILTTAWLGGRALWATARWKAGQQALARYEFAEALGEFESYLRVWPNSAPAQLQAARAARRADQYDRAEEHLAAAEKTGVTPETALENLLTRAQSGELAGTETALHNLLLDGHPDRVLIAEALTRGYLASLRLRDAETPLNILIEHAPDYHTAYSWRSALYGLTQRQPQAADDLRRAAKLAPERVEYRLRLAETLIKLARANEAWPVIQELKRLSPDSPAVLLCAARCLRSLGQPSRAVEQLDALLRDHPDDPEALAERGRLHAGQGESAPALRCFRKAFALTPTDYNVGLALHAALKAQGHDAEAVPLWNKLLELKKDEDRVLELNELIAQNPHNAALRYEMGVLCMRNNQEEGALRWFSGAIQDDPKHRPTHRALADYFKRKGDTTRAGVHRELAGPP